MKRMLLLPVALLAALVVAASAGADTKTVQITKSGFTPSSTAIMVGDSVTWHNADAVSHQVVANDGSFASPVLKSRRELHVHVREGRQGQYHDSFATSHKGTVTVTAPAGTRHADDVDVDRDLRRQHDRVGRGLEPAHE